MLELKSKLTQKKANLTDNARIVLEKRYLKKDMSGNVIEEPEEMFFRVANNIASLETDVKKWTEIFYDMMINLEFLPNSPTLMNAGRELQQLSACFVLPIGDSMEEIFDAVKYTALIHKSGGGTGFSFSKLRPKNDRVKSTKGISSGPISFMRVFDVTTDTIKQGGTRRGANMGILRCDHPDILDFINIKEKDGVLSNFNISVAITKEFMDALENHAEYPLRNPHDGQILSYLEASSVFNKIVSCAWKNGEPGIVFIDKINEFNPTPHIGEMESTNPCGEQPLLSFEACNLGSINLLSMVDTENKISYCKLEHTVENAVRYLDNVIDLNKYPLPQIEQMTKSNRKIGLGVMGFADMLVRLDIAFDSEEALKTIEDVMGFIQRIGHRTSVELAKERGPFPNYVGSIYDKSPEIRNATVTTIAPTGTISMIAGCSSGVEPLFGLVYEKHVLDKSLLEIHPEFLKVAKKENIYSEELMRLISKTGSIQHINDVPQNIKDKFKTAHDISPLCHVKIQAAFQKYIDNAVSKTVNFPNSATLKDVEDVYLAAYRMNCKGVTVYRDGSREHQVITAGKLEGFNKKGVISKDVQLPSVFENGPTHIIKKEGKKFYLHFSYLPEDIKHDYPIVLWIHTNAKYKSDELKICNKASRNLSTLALSLGVDKKYVDETLQKANDDYPHNRLGRMVSLCLRHNIPREDILVSLKNIDGDNISTLLTAVRKFLSKTLLDGTKLNGVVCPECGGTLIMESGCQRCPACQWSACG